MALFDESILSNLADQWKVVETKDHSKTNAYFNKYANNFIKEIMDYIGENGRKEAIIRRLSYLCKIHADDIELFLFSYKTTVFGDKKYNCANKPFKDGSDETYRDAAIRLGYHKLCLPIPTERTEDGEEEGAAPFHCVYDYTDVRYKIASMFDPTGNKFTVFKKWRPTNNSDEGFGNNKSIKTWQVSIYLKFYPLGINDDDWLAKAPTPSLSISQEVVEMEKKPEVVEEKKPEVVEENKPEEKKVASKKAGKKGSST